MKPNWSNIITILAFLVPYYIWLFVNSERGVFHMRNYRVEITKEPEKFRSYRTWMFALGIIIAAVNIGLWGFQHTQP